MCTDLKYLLFFLYIYHNKTLNQSNMAASIGRFQKPNKNIEPALMRRHKNKQINKNQSTEITDGAILNTSFSKCDTTINSNTQTILSH